MNKTLFYKLGSVIYTARWFIIVLWLLILIACIPILPHIMNPFKTTGFIADNSPSAQAEQELNNHLKYDRHNQLMIIYHSDTLTATSKQFNKKIKESLKDLSQFPLAHDVFLPGNNEKQLSKDKHTAYVVVVVKTMKPLHDDILNKFTWVCT